MNLFITNVKTGQLPLEAVLQLYWLRWQIELVFKTWKSIFNLHTVHSMKVERFKCVLYSRLFFYLYLLGIMPFRNKLYDCCNIWLSFWSCLESVGDHFQ